MQYKRLLYLTGRKWCRSGWKEALLPVAIEICWHIFPGTIKQVSCSSCFTEHISHTIRQHILHIIELISCISRHISHIRKQILGHQWTHFMHQWTHFKHQWTHVMHHWSLGKVTVGYLVIICNYITAITYRLLAVGLGRSPSPHSPDDVWEDQGNKFNIKVLWAPDMSRSICILRYIRVYDKTFNQSFGAT